MFIMRIYDVNERALIILNQIKDTLMIYKVEDKYKSYSRNQVPDPKSHMYVVDQIIVNPTSI